VAFRIGRVRAPPSARPAGYRSSDISGDRGVGFRQRGDGLNVGSALAVFGSEDHVFGRRMMFFVAAHVVKW
jgi:hypothetical protein